MPDMEDVQQDQDTRADTSDLEDMSPVVQVDMSDPAPERLTGNSIPQSELFTCTPDTLTASRGRLRRVERDEWRRNAGRWSGTAADNVPFLASSDHQYSSYTARETLDEAIIELYLGSIHDGSSYWASLPDGRSGNPSAHAQIMTTTHSGELACFFDTTQVPDRDCVERYTTKLLERGVLYRPAHPDEVRDLSDFAQAQLAKPEQSRDESVEMIVSAARMMPGALFRTESGDGEVDDAGRIHLSDQELAHSLVYVLDKRAPGSLSVHRHFRWHEEGASGYTADSVEGHHAAFTRAAEDGSIRDPEVIEALVRQTIAAKIEGPRYDLALEFGGTRSSSGMPKMNRASEYKVSLGVRDFFREWLGYEAIRTKPGQADVLATSRFRDAGNRYRQSYVNNISDAREDEIKFVEQLDSVIARIVVEDEDVLANLLTTSTFYVPAWITTFDAHRWKAAVYEIDEPITEDTREARWQTVPMRGGVLTHPAWLAAHGHPNENDPSAVERGKWVRENIFCQDVPGLPEGVDAMLDPETINESARTRIQSKTEEAECVGCHKLMNPLGYPFEIYNHTGFVREVDHGAEPDGSSVLLDIPDPMLDGVEVRDAIDMSAKFASSPYVKRCFIRQTFRYFVGRPEERADACTLQRMEAAYDEKGSFIDMVVALLTSDTFLYRWDSTQGEQP